MRFNSERIWSDVGRDRYHIMPVAKLAAALIRSFEGFRSTAYQDSGGVWTIGFGHTANVKQGDQITMAAAAGLLESDAEPLFVLVADKPLIAAGAYVSFGYNCGRHALELVLVGTATLTNFVHDKHGNVQPGLVNRRGLEQALIDSADPAGPKTT